MKICGLHAGHDCSFAVLNEGRPEIHLELERFIRKKNQKMMRISSSKRNTQITRMFFITLTHWIYGSRLISLRMTQ